MLQVRRIAWREVKREGEGEGPKCVNKSAKGRERETAGRETEREGEAEREEERA